MSIQDSIKHKLLEIKPELSHRFFVDKIGMFGSVNRMDFNETSDVDLIVAFNKPVGIEFLDLADYLESKLHRKVDLITFNGIKKHFFEAIKTALYMSKRSLIVLLKDIIESGEKINKYTAGLTFEEFKDNDLIADAVIRNFEIIGEAANRLPDEFKESNRDID